MPRRVRVLLPLIPVFASVVMAGGKERNYLPPAVLRARTVLVLIDPQAGVSLNAPTANQTAQQDVEKALMKWGRLQPVMDAETADLVITVRKGSGRIAQETIGGIPNNRPVVVESSGDTTRIGVQQGRDPAAEQSEPPKIGPHPQVEVGSSDDMMVVYVGHVDHPLDQPAAWRYAASGALDSPEVPAVEKLRKAIEDAEKQQKSKP